MKFPIILVIELVCLIIAFLFLIGQKNSWWRYFVPFMLFTFLIELAGYTIHFIYDRSTHGLYNFYLPISTIFILYILNQLNRIFNERLNLLRASLALFFLIYFAEILINGFDQFANYAYFMSGILVVVLSLTFYYQLMKDDQYRMLLKYPEFWLVSGLLMFFLGTMACTIFADPLKQMYLESGIPVRFYIMVVLNLILYSCWSYAFIWKHLRSK